MSEARETLTNKYRLMNLPVYRTDEEVELEFHKGCGGEVQSLGDDGISYCTDCEVICEGDTEFLTEAQRVARYE